MFKRISQAAASRNDEERKRRIRQLEVLEEMNETLKAARKEKEKEEIAATFSAEDRANRWMEFMLTGQ